MGQAREKFKEFPQIPEGLDIMEEQEQLTHQLELTENYPTHVEFDVFRHVDGWEVQDADYAVGLPSASFRSTAGCCQHSHLFLGAQTSGHQPWWLSRLEPHRSIWQFASLA